MLDANCDLELWSFDPKTRSVHPCPKMPQRKKLDENMSNTFQDIVLTTSGMHGQTDAQTAWKHNAQPHYAGRSITKNVPINEIQTNLDCCQQLLMLWLHRLQIFNNLLLFTWFLHTLCHHTALLTSTANRCPPFPVKFCFFCKFCFSTFILLPGWTLSRHCEIPRNFPDSLRHTSTHCGGVSVS